MDKYEYKIRADEIKDLIADGDFAEAARKADGIDWRRVKSVMMLCTISDVYKINRRYEDAKELLLLAYDRRPGGRTVCYSLCELCIKMGDYVQALKYYKEFTQVAPRDSSRYILQYRLYEAQEVSLEERIAVLEELKKRDYREKWAYELAYLYHRAGLAARCVEECDELILWFGEGRYVVKAMELKMLHQPLTPMQQQMYEHRFDRRQPEEEISQPEGYGEEAAYDQPEGYDGEAAYGQSEGYGEEAVYGRSEGYGEEAAYGQSEGYGEEAAYGQSEGYGEDVSYSQSEDYGGEAAYGQSEGYGEDVSYGQLEGYGGDAAYGQPEGYGEEVSYTQAQPDGWQSRDGQGGTDGGYSPEGQAEVSPELDIQVKPIDVGEYNTINLQAELAAGLKEVLGAENVGYMEYVPDGSHKSDAEGPMKDAKGDVEGTEVFFGETGELDEDQPDAQTEPFEVSIDSEEEVPSERGLASGKGMPLEEVPASGKGMPLEEVSASGKETSSEDGAVSGRAPAREGVAASSQAPYPEKVTAARERQETGEASGQEAAQAFGADEEERKERMLTAQPPKELEDLLQQETDGQIGIALPEKVNVEKQITGQMKLEDVLAEWERTKKENEEKCKEEVRRNVRRDTGNMFNEFEMAARDGLLEKLESGASADGEAVQEEQPKLSAPASEEFSAEEEAWEAATDEIEGTAEDAMFEEMEFLEAAEPTAEGNSDTEGLESMEALEAVEEMESAGNEGISAIAEENIEGRQEGRSPQQEAQNQEGKEGQRPSIERDKEKIRSLTREEKELYAPFIQSRHSREQLVKAIDNISMAAYTGNVVITGEEGMDTMTLAKNMIREVKMTDSNFSGKVAKITGQGLNQRNVKEILEQFKNGALIIQDAAGMEAKTALMLYRSLQQERVGIIVVMEDTKKAIQKLFLGTPELFSCFTARMDLEAFSNDTLVSFGRRYAREMEYSIDDLGVLALHTRIEELQTIDHVVTVIEVKRIVDEAIRHARRKTLGHFMDVLLAKRYDDEDMIILTEKDFVA